MSFIAKIMEESALFAGLEPAEVEKLLKCLSAQECRYADRQMIWEAGMQTDRMGLVLEGRIHLETDDFWGNKFIFSEVLRGATFGEAYALSAGETLPFNAVAQGECRVLFLDARRMAWMCGSACTCHRMLNERLLRMISAQSMESDRKMKHLSGRTTRDKLLSYLSAEALRQKSPYITLPFNRQELADYLSVERSAMSRELSRMKAEGLLDYSRSMFLLKK